MELMPPNNSSPSQMPEPVTLDVGYNDRISRLFIFRPLWWCVELFVVYVWMIWIGLVGFVHFWYMLILGKRQPTLWKKQLRFMRHLTKWQAYMMNLSNERPDFVTE